MQTVFNACSRNFLQFENDDMMNFKKKTTNINFINDNSFKVDFTTGLERTAYFR